MNAVSVVGLFCEDIREEKSGADILISILPDNLSIPQIPSLLPKLCLYIRVHFDTSRPVGNISARLTMLDNSEVSVGGMSAEEVEKVRVDSQNNGSPISGVILKAILSPFPVPMPGRLSAVVRVGSEEQLCASLRVHLTGA